MAKQIRNLTNDVMSLSNKNYTGLYHKSIVIPPSGTVTVSDSDYAGFGYLNPQLFQVTTVSDQTTQLIIEDLTAAGYGGTGGGGLIVITDGGTLSGTYQGSVIVEGEGLGSATITGDIIVYGSLWCQNLTNSGGYSVEVYGDLLISGNGNFTPSDPTSNQGLIIVHGSFRYGYFEMKINPDKYPYLYVYGDLISLDDDFIAYGQDGAQGLGMWIAGNAMVNYMDLHGGDATATHYAGSGGSLGVGGNLITYDGLDLYGGSSSYNGQSANNGGQIWCAGHCMAYINAYGGSSSANASAGDGNYISIAGTLSCWWLNNSGGDCASTDPTHYAGYAGNVYAGQIVGDGQIFSNGGHRTGTLTAEPTSLTQAPNGGYIESYGDLHAARVIAYGGANDAVSPLGVSNSTGGQGGQVFVYGDTVVWRYRLYGGSAHGQSGGNGGYLTVKGRISAERQIDCSGGSSDLVNGSPSWIIAKGGLLTSEVTLLDGQGTGSVTTNGCGLQLGGSVNIATLNQCDRTGSNIQPFMNNKILLTVGSMPTKKTLTQPNSTNTQDVSAYLGTSVFLYDSVAGWNVLTGTSLA